uniref:Uncharacterized protein n=1 Tax=Candidatus Kentrum sp. FW TaxID=2126338 RepID=A0A450T9A4_9GAMM|nr:MAG: hypothetical protein BECKFW1821B_GA0114236_10816 [Candidatus Kentron sp. FW]
MFFLYPHGSGFRGRTNSPENKGSMGHHLLKFSDTPDFRLSLARPRLGPLIHHLFLPSLVLGPGMGMLPSLALGPGMGMLPSLALGPGIPCRDDVKVVTTSHVIPAGNAGT